MRRWISVTALAAVALAPAAAAAQDAEALRKELEQMKKQFERMKDSYEKSINKLSERLRRSSRRRPPRRRTATDGTGGEPGAAGRARGPPPSGGMPSLMELARPRQPFALYSVGAPVSSSSTSASPVTSSATSPSATWSKAQGGTFPGLENYFFPREVELSLFGQIDPYARAEVHLRGGARSRAAES